VVLWRPLWSGAVVSHRGGEGVLLGRPVQGDGGDGVLRGDQQRLVCRPASGGLCGHGGGALAFCCRQGANQVAVLLPGFVLRDTKRFRPPARSP